MLPTMRLPCVSQVGASVLYSSSNCCRYFKTSSFSSLSTQSAYSALKIGTCVEQNVNIQVNMSTVKLFKSAGHRIENQDKQAGLPCRDGVHLENTSEDVRHNEECRFFLHNNNLQSRGKTENFKINHSLLHKEDSLL